MAYVGHSDPIGLPYNYTLLTKSIVAILLLVYTTRAFKFIRIIYLFQIVGTQHWCWIMRGVVKREYWCTEHRVIIIRVQIYSRMLLCSSVEFSILEVVQSSPVIVYSLVYSSFSKAGNRWQSSEMTVASLICCYSRTRNLRYQLRIIDTLPFLPQHKRGLKMDNRSPKFIYRIASFCLCLVTLGKPGSKPPYVSLAV